MGELIHVNSFQQFKDNIAKANLTAVDHFAQWCPPCRFISPVFEKLAAEMPEVNFLKVDVDEQKEVAEYCSIRAMPTFQFFKNGEMITEFAGADKNKLIATLNQHK